MLIYITKRLDNKAPAHRPTEITVKLYHHCYYTVHGLSPGVHFFKAPRLFRSISGANYFPVICDP